MGGPETYETLQHLAHDALTWVGFGFLAGLLAKAIMPGRDPGGPVATLMMGCGGSVIGSGLLVYFGDNQRVTPISPLGFVVATTGAFVLLAFYRLLSGRIIREDGEGYDPGPRRAPYYARRNRRRRTVYDD
ncbi:MAG TPA: GlsB/YeaQ/YmgE family stress response membrane protein [Pirellulales bacterium]|nr:GlsB/YeaQ/YmgE family stress response membrane protein [Pirellulales bacterium]